MFILLQCLSFWDLGDLSVRCFDVVPQILEFLLQFFLTLFSLFYLDWIICIDLFNSLTLLYLHSIIALLSRSFFTVVIFLVLKFFF